MSLYPCYFHSWILWSLNSLNGLVNYTLTNFAFIRAPLIREVWRSAMYIMHCIFLPPSFLSRHRGRNITLWQNDVFYVRRFRRPTSLSLRVFPPRLLINSVANGKFSQSVQSKLDAIRLMRFILDKRHVSISNHKLFNISFALCSAIEIMRLIFAIYVRLMGHNFKSHRSFSAARCRNLIIQNRRR